MASIGLRTQLLHRRPKLLAEPAHSRKILPKATAQDSKGTDMTPLSKETVEQEQYLTFLLCGEEYAISILRAKEIIGYDTVTTVPKTPKWVRGVINLRGSV